jgi:hypothetical protein
MFPSAIRWFTRLAYYLAVSTVAVSTAHALSCTNMVPSALDWTVDSLQKLTKKYGDGLFAPILTHALTTAINFTNAVLYVSKYHFDMTLSALICAVNGPSLVAEIGNPFVIDVDARREAIVTLDKDSKLITNTDVQEKICKTKKWREPCMSSYLCAALSGLAITLAFPLALFSVFIMSYCIATVYACQNAEKWTDSLQLISPFLATFALTMFAQAIKYIRYGAEQGRNWIVFGLNYLMFGVYHLMFYMWTRVIPDVYWNREQVEIFFARRTRQQLMSVNGDPLTIKVQEFGRRMVGASCGISNQMYRLSKHANACDDAIAKYCLDISLMERREIVNRHIRHNLNPRIMINNAHLLSMEEPKQLLQILVKRD